MADALNFVINKQPYKIIEVPLAKFTEDVIPHHQNVYQQYKSSIKKLLALNNYEQLEKEIKEKKRNVKQLRNLMYELDTLRTQVEDEDLDKFDMETLSLRKIILNLITGYTELEKTVNQVIERQNVELEKENLEPFEGTSQIQMQQTIEEIKLKQREEQLNKVENIHKDVQDLNDIYKNLNEMVVNQADVVNQISNDVDNTQQNVIEGTRTLAKAHKLKAVAYPVTGAFLGGMIGGPIGLVAGLKVGGAAAVACAIAGYTGGRWFKKKHLDQECQGIEQGSSQDEDAGKKDM
ncbi:syntaxin-17 isoform X1 [Diorhabda sublineata]|uniref:syntaxin-17 isoform X1 n=1 Tax=Diorhabda sublineata TaxID=1163346 RepID=UPI0024E066EF|nr:syntaxin-17 isoform X1 [Diorhabda sublineata]